MSDTIDLNTKLPTLSGDRGMSALIPKDIDQAFRLSQVIADSGMAPKGYDGHPKKTMVAIMHGMELGLKPMQSLQAIALINGRPTIYGDAIMAIVRGSGRCHYVKEWIDGGVAWCETARLGEVEPIKRSFSTDDAKRAGLLNKSGPWSQYTERMLQMRARAFCLRDAYADVLSGIQCYEEVSDYQSDDFVRNPEPLNGSADKIDHGTDTVGRLPKSKARDLFSELQADIDACGDEETLMQWGQDRSVDLKALPPDWQKELRVRFTEHRDELREKLLNQEEDLDNEPAIIQ